jgi:hypothetical protein
MKWRMSTGKSSAALSAGAVLAIGAVFWAASASAQNAAAPATAYSVKQLPPDCRDETLDGVATKHCGGLHFKLINGHYAQVKISRNGRDRIVSSTAYSVTQLPPNCNTEFVRGVEYQHCGGLHMKQDGDRWVQIYAH